MLMNAFYGVWSYLYILQIFNQEKSGALTNFAREFDFKDKKILVRIRDIHKIEKIKSVNFSLFLVMTKWRNI